MVWDFPRSIDLGPPPPPRNVRSFLLLMTRMSLVSLEYQHQHTNTGTRTTNRSRLGMSSGNIGTAHRNGFGLGAFEARDQIDDIYGDEDDMSNYNRAIDAVRKKFAHTCIITR